METAVQRGVASRVRALAAGERARLALAFVALAGAATVLYAPSVRNGFVWDDEAQVVANRWLTGWSHVGEIFTSGVWDFERTGLTNYYRPLMHLSYLAVYQAFGPVPWAFHALSVLANAVTSGLVMLLAWTLQVKATGDRALLAPLLAGLLFAVHPAHSEAVLWIAALPDLGATGCAALSLALYVRHLGRARRPGPALYAAAAAFLAGALFKETALVLPLLLGACELRLAARDAPGARARRLAPFGAALVVYAILRIHALGAFMPGVEAHGQASPAGFAGAAALAWRYAGMLLLPHDLTSFDAVAGAAAGSTWTVMGGAAALVALVAVTVAGWRADAIVGVGLVLVVAGFLPAFYTSAISGARVAERYVYFPSAGLAIALAGVARRVAAHPAGRVAAIGAVAVAGLIGAVEVGGRIPVWHDDLALWTDAASKAPELAEPRYNVAVARMRRGEHAAAVRDFRASLELGPSPALAASALNDLGRIYDDLGDRALAVDHYRRAVEADAGNAGAQANLGAALAEAGQPGRAIEHLAAAAQLRPGDASIHLNLGMALLDAGRPDEAVAELQSAQRLAPGDPEIQARLRAARGVQASRGRSEAGAR